MQEEFTSPASIYDTFNSSAPHSLPALPYAENALEPVISVSTLSFHYGKHHKEYVEALNKLVLGTPFAEMNLEQIIEATAGKSNDAAIFNNAAEAWNHTFYWHSLRPRSERAIPSALSAKIDAAFLGIDGLKKELSAVAAGQFGSGWVWLIIDVWEHAYYFDYQSRRADHVDAPRQAHQLGFRRGEFGLMPNTWSILAGRKTQVANRANTLATT